MHAIASLEAKTIQREWILVNSLSKDNLYPKMPHRGKNEEALIQFPSCESSLVCGAVRRARACVKAASNGAGTLDYPNAPEENI